MLTTGCQTAPSGNSPSAPENPLTEITSHSATVQKLIDEARALEPLATSELTKRFLHATATLPAIAPRTVLRNDQTREYFSAAKAAVLPEAQRARLVPVELDEYRYYYTKYGSPLAYMRALDLAAANGLGDVSGKRILDYGYGSIGHLRLLASLGAHVTGVDVDSYLDALYSQPEDNGPVKGRLFHSGSVTLVNGSYPKDTTTKNRVGQGFDLIVSKNTLKRGYIKPERKVEKRLLVDLGVSEGVFLKTLFDALKPGGKLIIYNLYPKQADAKEAYKPMADGRSPFSQSQFEQAGFRVIAIDANDDAAARRIGHVLGWEKNEKGEIVDDLEKNLFALYSIVERPVR